MTVQSHVSSALSRLGYETQSCGHFKHEIIRCMLTAPLISSFTNKMFDQFLKKKYEESRASSSSGAS